MKFNKTTLVFFLIVVILILSAVYLFTYINEGFETIDLVNYENKVFSQNGEDGITIKLIELIYDDPKNKYFVEFGVEGGTECNTRILREQYNWTGLLMDGSYENDSVNLKKAFITKENIIELFKTHNVPQHINLLCTDIDYNDFYCLKEILAHYTCDILICEYNATHPPDEDKIVIYDKDGMWDSTNYFGFSLLSLDKLAKQYNYSIVYCNNTGSNCFLIRDEIITNRNLQFKNIGNIEKLYKPPNYGTGPNNGHTADAKNRKFIGFDEAILL